MPLAVTHILLTIILVDLYRDYFCKHKKYFSLHTIFIAGVGGLMPDIDIPINWILQLFGFSFMHGGITHTPLFGLFFLIPGLILWKRKKHKQSMYFFVITFGIMFHLLLDLVLGGGAYEGVMLFWPITSTTFKIHLLSRLSAENIPAALDAIILLLWLWHEEAKHKISDFI